MPFGTIVEYKGIELRSLHELAWARFWTRAGLAWAYEPTRFYHGRESYTPDFLIGKTYIEIKTERAKNLNNFSLCIENLIVIYGKPERHYIHFKPAGAARFETGHTTWPRIYQKVFV